MKADLHIHTWCSTGTQTPAEVLHEAVAKGIGLVSITDDDTTDAYQELPEIAAQCGIRYIPGVEVSATHNGGPLRLLAYGCASEDEALQTLLAANRRKWDQFGALVINMLSADHPELSVLGYEAYVKNPQHGGFKLHSFLTHSGLDGSYDTAILKDLARDPGNAAQFKAAMTTFSPVEEVISIVHGAGGCAVVSGGYLRNPDTLRADLDDLLAVGIDGLECFSPSHNGETSELLRDFAHDHHLLVTGGGNGHGTWTDPNQYGIGLLDIDDHDLNLGGLKTLAHRNAVQ